jgi:hypothetical protein
MPATAFIQCRVDPEFKARARALAAHRHLTESQLVKYLLQTALDGSQGTALQKPLSAGPKGRLHIRLHRDDRLLLTARAAARGMPAATYVSVLTRSHLRCLAPLPKEELLLLKRCVSDLGAVGRNLNQIAKTGLSHSGSVREDLRAMLKIAQSMRDHVKALLKANLDSWIGLDDR